MSARCVCLSTNEFLLRCSTFTCCQSSTIWWWWWWCALVYLLRSSLSDPSSSGEVVQWPQVMWGSAQKSVVQRSHCWILSGWKSVCMQLQRESEGLVRPQPCLPLSALCFASSVSLSPFPPLVAHPTHPLLPPPPSPPTIKPSFPALFFLFALLRLTNWVYKADVLLMFFPLSCFVSSCTVYVFWAACNKFPACRSHCLFPFSSAPSPHKFVCPH